MKAHGQKTHHTAKWPQEIDNEWNSHPNFPTGPYGDAHEQSLVSKPHKKGARKHHKPAKAPATKPYLQKKPTPPKKQNAIHFSQKNEKNAEKNNCTSINCFEDTIDPYTMNYEYPDQHSVPYMGMDPDVVNPTKDKAANAYGTWSL